MMDMENRIHGDQRGLVGKFMLVWLLLLAIVVVLAADGISIAVNTFKLSDIAQQAASDAVVVYRQGDSPAQTCEVARSTIASADPGLKLGKNFCIVSTEAREVTITLRTTAHTFLVGRLEFTKDYANIVETETAGESAV
jgi:hypothetical protein